MSTFGDNPLTWIRENRVQRFARELDLNRAINAHFGGSPKGRPYPNGRYKGTCDVAVPSPGARFRWVEVKYAQTYFSQVDLGQSNLDLFEKYVFSESPSEHSVRNDLVRKLSSLDGHPSVTSAGMLVIFLYSETYPLPPDTFGRLNIIASTASWSKNTLTAWRNPDHKSESSWILPIYWERTGHQM